MQKFVLCICTYRRPDYLARCLESVQAMAIPSSLVLSVVVVDNAPDKRNHDIVSMHGYHYHMEPHAGLVYARNKALECALELQPDYIGFIDDDETVCQDWLIQMLQGMEYTQADALAGAIEIIVPPDVDPLLKQAYQFKIPADYHPSKTLPMGNVVFKRQILDNGLRFDMRFNHTGGEDVDFFARAAQDGARLYRSPYGRVYEYLTPAKQSLRAWWQRQVRVTQIHCQQKRRPIALMFLQAIAEAVTALLFLLPALLSGHYKLRVLKFSAKALGRFCAIGRMPKSAYGNL